MSIRKETMDSEKVTAWITASVFVFLFVVMLSGAGKMPDPIDSATPEQIAVWAESREDCYAGKLYYNQEGFRRVAKPGSTCDK